MTTLITASDDDGVIGTCDARCYNAKGGDCHCVCYGLNHGKGKDFAITFTDHFYELITRTIKTRFPTVTLVTIHQPRIELTFHAPTTLDNPHEHPTQIDGANRDESHR